MIDANFSNRMIVQWFLPSVGVWRLNKYPLLSERDSSKPSYFGVHGGKGAAVIGPWECNYVVGNA